MSEADKIQLAMRQFELVSYALINAIGMYTANMERASRGLAQAYPEAEFAKLAEETRSQFRGIC